MSLLPLSLCRQAFQWARGAPPAILFLDEVDAMVGKRGIGTTGGSAAQSGCITSLLALALSIMSVCSPCSLKELWCTSFWSLFVCCFLHYETRIVHLAAFHGLGDRHLPGVLQFAGYSVLHHFSLWPLVQGFFTDTCCMADVSTSVLATLLNEMDGVEWTNGVIVIGATNRLDMIDPALLRSVLVDCAMSPPCLICV